MYLLRSCQVFPLLFLFYIYRIPHYTKVMAAIQEGVTSILADNDEEMGAVSIVGNYQKHQQKKHDAAQNKVKQKEVDTDFPISFSS